jgi:diaminobutyrate-2-oxoglutarate transaminase
LSQLTGKYYLDRQAETESNARTYPRKFPVAIRRAEGLYVTGVDGKVYMDCLCGAGTLALGHNHPAVISAIRRHLDEGYPLHTLDLTTPVKHDFVEGLLGTLPRDFAEDCCIQFCSPSGSDAVEAAIKLVKTATGRQGIVAFQGGYHGHTHGALALMGNCGPKLPGLMPDVSFQPYPYAYRCPMGKGDCRNCTCADFTGQALGDPEGGLRQPAGIVLEVVQGEGGAVPSDAGWLSRIRDIATERRIPLILDEVQTGWGRTGTLYAFESSGVLPDVLILSKAIGGGLPRFRQSLLRRVRVLFAHRRLGPDYPRNRSAAPVTEAPVRRRSCGHALRAPWAGAARLLRTNPGSRKPSRRALRSFCASSGKTKLPPCRPS